ncbi:thiosulfate oxidation carrier protein SoxY [Marinospirillum alkaliphilum]|uniref:Sulfur-oxidizing protein SoxY n=1 Tax=Marinospirillum alkaliphilum DSM 21637 TaxID=1122209 RepID=A0A1K1ZH76_9GAMM|nr:thiosulfate oxidation carrier protein SoxY [Marinospirillum alkaliphilum]SFX73455.1 sulfur-oxidizing protein SoxY [Marinospirillum alkaliphilum DSM 21637]
MIQIHTRFLLPLAALLLAFLISLPLQAASWQQFAPVQAQIKGTPASEGLQLELPLVSEDGSAVPLSVRFTGSLAEGDQLESIRIFATANPNAEIIDFIFHDARSLADLSTRVRLNETQNVIALATSRNGRQWVAEREVRVTVSGCLMRSDEQADAGMQNPRIALPRRLQAGQPIEIRTLISHPMETGLRKAADGKLLPQNLIHNMVLELDQQPVFEARFYTGTSANPYVRLHLKTDQNAMARFRWTDQQKQQLEEAREISLR